MRGFWLIKIKSDMDCVQKRLNKKAKKFEEENELNFLRKKIVETEKSKSSHFTKEELIKNWKKSTIKVRIGSVIIS